MVYLVSWTAVITLLIKKVGMVRPNLGVRTPPPPMFAPLHGESLLLRFYGQAGSDS